ncbi:MAG: hypothetical protein GX606_00245 [Elusimicrobia bacterium]|nr:hypothetical protein [Elusimicrobiota bacterium]
MNKGLTVIEVVVSLAVFLVVSLGVFEAMTVGWMVYSRDTALLDLQQDVRRAMDRIVREVRESGASTVSVVDDDSDTLSFDTPNEQDIDYYLYEGELIREYPPDVYRTVAEGISRLKFIKSGESLVIDIEGERMYRQTPITFSLRETVRLRNE